MSDIFISYAREDEPRAARLAGVLRDEGYSVWWDRKIPPGRSFDEVIEEALDAAVCVLVLWSRDSVGSRWVRNEAAAALERDCLIPISLDDATVPLAFRGIQSVQLAGWKGGAGHPEFKVLLQALGERITARDSDGSAARQARVPENARLQENRGNVRWGDAIRRRLPSLTDKLLQRLIVADVVLAWLLGFVILRINTTYGVPGWLFMIVGDLAFVCPVALAVASLKRRFWRGTLVATLHLITLLFGAVLAEAGATLTLSAFFVSVPLLAVTVVGYYAWLGLRRESPGNEAHPMTGATTTVSGSIADS